MDLSSQLQQLQQMDQKEESLVVQLQDYIKNAKRFVSKILDVVFEDSIESRHLNDMSLFNNDKYRYSAFINDSDNSQENTNGKSDTNEYKRYYCYILILQLYLSILLETSKMLSYSKQLHELALSTFADIPRCIYEQSSSSSSGKNNDSVNSLHINREIHGTTLREAFDTIMSLSLFREVFVNVLFNSLMKAEPELSYNNCVDLLDSIEGEGDFERFKVAIKHMGELSELFINLFSPLNKKSLLIIEAMPLMVTLPYKKEVFGLCDENDTTLYRLIDDFSPKWEFNNQFFHDFYSEVGTVPVFFIYSYIIAMKKHIIPNLSINLQQTLDSFWEIIGMDKKYLENDLDCFSRLLAAEKKRQTSVNQSVKDDNELVKDDKPNDIQEKIKDITKIKQYIKVAARYDVDKLVDFLTKRHELDGEAFGPLISAANNDSADSAKDHLRYFLTGIGDAREFNLRWNKDNMHLHFLIRILLTENLAINENNAVTIFSEKTISKSRPDDISFEESREPIWPSVEAVFNRKNLISSTWRFRKKDDTRNGHQKTLQNIARIVFACDVKS